MTAAFDPIAIGVLPDEAPPLGDDDAPPWVARSSQPDSLPPPEPEGRDEQRSGNIEKAFGGKDASEAASTGAPAAGVWEPFPVGNLPEPYSSYVEDTARARQCDPAAVALPLLAALAGTIGNARSVRIWPDWLAPAVLWAAVVAPSGATKSPAFRSALAALEEIERSDREKWHLEHAEYEAKSQVHKADLAEWSHRKKADRGAPPEGGTEPTLPRCIVEDTTLQALGDVLSENPRGVLCARDELSGWVRSFDQFTGAGGADVARWLEIHRAGPLRVDRKADGHLYVPRAAVSICGTIQTDILPRVFGGEHQAAGLLARFLLAAPPEPSRRWALGRAASAPDTSELVRRFQALRALDLPEEGEGKWTVELSSEAATMFGEWFDRHQARRQGAEPAPWRAALSKLEELPGRLALVLALASAASPAHVTEVDGDIMRRAIALTEWFVAEGERVYGMMVETPEIRKDRELVEWVARCSKPPRVRDVVRGHARYRLEGGTDAAKADLIRLVDAGKLVAIDQPVGPKGGRWTVAYGLPGSGDTTSHVDHMETGENGDGDGCDSDRTPVRPLRSPGSVTVTSATGLEGTPPAGGVTARDRTICEGEI
jgi:hypothetical protein